jgi:sRNA-binding carbon storage regulator CsrA
MSRLVLHRKEDENVVIHKDGEIICLVKLTEARRSSARLLFEASDDVDIDREEVFQRKYNIV